MHGAFQVGETTILISDGRNTGAPKFDGFALSIIAKTESEADKIFGSPALTEAWWRAIVAHPIAYLQHRAALMANFLFNQNLRIDTVKAGLNYSFGSPILARY